MTPEERAEKALAPLLDAGPHPYQEQWSDMHSMSGDALVEAVAAAIREAVEEERRNTGWQLIDIAPRDKKILAWNGKEYTVAWFGAVDTLSDAYVGWMDSESRELDTFLDPEPTHWMALPEPPLER